MVEERAEGGKNFWDMPEAKGEVRTRPGGGRAVMKGGNGRGRGEGEGYW